MNYILAIIIIALSSYQGQAQDKQVEIPIDLVKQIEEVAEHQGRTVNVVIEDAIRSYLISHPLPSVTKKTKINTSTIDPVSLSTIVVLNDGTEVAFSFASNRLWTTGIPTIQLKEFWRFFYVTMEGKEIDANRPYIKTKTGGTAKVSMTVEDGPAVIGINELGWYLKLRRTPGLLLIKLQAGDSYAYVEIPIHDAGLTGNSVDELVASHGLGDHDDSIYVGWPDSEWADGIFYSPSASESVSVNHWRWHSHPSLVVSIDGSTIKAIHSSTEELTIESETELFQDADLSMKLDYKNTYGFIPARVVERTKTSIALALYTGLSIPENREKKYVKHWVPINKTRCKVHGCPLAD